MKLLIRGILTALTAVAAFYFVYWVGGALLTSLGLSYWIATLAAILAALAAGRYVWRRTGSFSGGFASSVATGAIVIGAIGFVAGFFGPLVFVPEANQGPLLGIFLTGPAGFLLGAVAGGVYWLVQRKKNAPRGTLEPPGPRG